MKKSLLLFGAVILLSAVSHAQPCTGTDTLVSTPVVLTAPASFVTDDADFVAFNPDNADEAWVTGKAGMLVKITANNGVWSATQQSTSFSSISTRRFRYLQFVSNNDWRLVGDGASGTDSAIVFQSTNQGTTWSIFTKVPTQEVYFVKAHPTNANWMIAGSRAGIWVSRDNGSTWVQQSPVPGQRYYGVDINTTTGRVTVVRRAGVVLSTVVTDFSATGQDNLTWTNEITETTSFTVDGSPVVFGGSKVNLVISTNNQATRWVVADNPDGAALLRSSATGTWEVVTITGYDYNNHGELRWIASWSDDVIMVVDNAGGMFYTTNATAGSPTWSFMQANGPSPINFDYSLNAVAVVPNSNPPSIMVAGGVADPTINLFPIINHITCSNLASSVANLSKQSLAMYPNPVENQLILSQEQAGKVTVRNLLGAVVLTAQKEAGVQSIAMQQLPAGMYVVELQTANQHFSGRIVKK
ncbi:MAG: T9SS type A sorting domain-containing protein [Bacteroidia bacterium]